MTPEDIARNIIDDMAFRKPESPIKCIAKHISDAIAALNAERDEKLWALNKSYEERVAQLAEAEKEIERLSTLAYQNGQQFADEINVHVKEEDALRARVAELEVQVDRRFHDQS